MVNIVSNVRDLCSPALIYLIVAIILLIESLIYEDDVSIGDQNKKNTVHITNIIIGIVIIAFVTFILNKLCASGYNKLSWAILILYVFIYGFHGSIGFSISS